MQIDVLEILPQFLTQTNIVFGERREATLSQRYEVIHDPRDKSKLLDPIYQEKLRQIDQILLENLWQVTNWHFAYFVDWLLSERYPEDYSFCIERGPLIERIPPAEFLVPHYDIDCIYWEIKRLFLFFPTTM